MKVVLLPGLDGTGILFKPFIDSLPNDVKTLVISYPPDIKLDYEELVEFVISELPEDNCILVAESFSGPIAHQVVLQKLKNVKSVIYVATFLGSPRRYLLRISHLLPTKFIFAVSIPNFIIKRLLFNFATNEQVINLFKQSIRQVSPDVLSFRLNQLAKLPNDHGISKIRASYIQASDDKLISKSCIEAFKKVFDNINVFHVKGSHFILQTNPSACAEIVANEIRYITSN